MVRHSRRRGAQLCRAARSTTMPSRRRGKAGIASERQPRSDDVVWRRQLERSRPPRLCTCSSPAGKHFQAEEKNHLPPVPHATSKALLTLDHKANQSKLHYPTPARPCLTTTPTTMTTTHGQIPPAITYAHHKASKTSILNRPQTTRSTNNHTLQTPGN